MEVAAAHRDQIHTHGQNYPNYRQRGRGMAGPIYFQDGEDVFSYSVGTNYANYQLPVLPKKPEPEQISGRRTNPKFFGYQ